MECMVLLCRHGNTFAAGETPYMVGSAQDLELTEEGEHQAQKVGWALSKSGVEIGQIISAPLRRTQKFAQIVMQELAPFSRPLFQTDARLSELDYGEWSGKSALEIEQSFGSKALNSWNELGEWPNSASFLPPREQVERELSSLLDEVVKMKRTTCLVTSQGRIKVLVNLLNLKTSKKMGTGRVSLLTFSGQNWNHLGWNLTPDELEKVLENKGSAR